MGERLKVKGKCRACSQVVEVVAAAGRATWKGPCPHCKEAGRPDSEVVCRRDRSATPPAEDERVPDAAATTRGRPVRSKVKKVGYTRAPAPRDPGPPVQRTGGPDDGDAVEHTDERPAGAPPAGGVEPVANALPGGRRRRLGRRPGAPRAGAERPRSTPYGDLFPW